MLMMGVNFGDLIVLYKFLVPWFISILVMHCMGSCLSSLSCDSLDPLEL